MTKASDFDDILYPYACVFAVADQVICFMLREKTSAELDEIEKACEKPTEVNCWYAIYRVAPIVKNCISVIRAERSVAND